VKILGLLRHAKSDLDDASLRDFDRGLNDRGRRGAALIGRDIAEQGIAWDAVLASPAERVRRTLEATGLPLSPRYDDRAYLADAATLIELLRAIEGDPASVLLIGHNPGLHELVFRLVDPDRETALFAEAVEKFPTASFAVLELAIDAWANISPGCGELVHFARPRDLDPELGPERVR
jgi:phosphohistidine phosphatase